MRGLERILLSGLGRLPKFGVFLGMVLEVMTRNEATFDSASTSVSALNKEEQARGAHICLASLWNTHCSL